MTAVAFAKFKLETNIFPHTRVWYSSVRGRIQFIKSQCESRIFSIVLSTKIKKSVEIFSNDSFGGKVTEKTYNNHLAGGGEESQYS